MEPIIAQAFGPDSSILGRIIAIIVLIAIGVFFYMLRSSRSARRDSPESLREEHEREQRAEAIAEQARRELAEKRKSGS
jgi:hypothetical protein